MFSSTVRRVAVAALAMPALLVAAAATASASAPGRGGSDYDVDVAAAGAMPGGFSGAMAVSTHSSAGDETGPWGWHTSTDHDADAAFAGTTTDLAVPLAAAPGRTRPWSAPTTVENTTKESAAPVRRESVASPIRQSIRTSHRQPRSGPAHHQSGGTAVHYDHTVAAAGVGGAAVDSTESDASTGHHGDSWGSGDDNWAPDGTAAEFHHVVASAGMNGADISETHSSAGTGGHHGHGWVEHDQSTSHAGADGAWVDSTDSGASS